MKALILAAGIGSRLLPITNEIPKSLVEVNGVPILYKQIKNLQKNEITDIIIVSGYKSEVLMDFIDKNFKNITIIQSTDFINTNNMYSAYLARDLLYGEEFLLMNADVFFDEQIVTDLLNNPHGDLIATDVGSYNEESMKVIEKGGRIVDISKQITEDEALGNSIDVYKFSSEGGKEYFKACKKYIEEQGEFQLWSEVALKDALDKADFRPAPIKGRWMEIDNMDDLEKAEKIFSEKVK